MFISYMRVDELLLRFRENQQSTADGHKEVDLKFHTDRELSS